MSDSRRERLMDIQKREQLKGMLINKFKLKYGDKPSLSKYIDNEVARFLKNGRLTEDNLRNLDTKINKEADLREKREAILDDRKSEGGRSAAGSVRSRPLSVASRRSGAAAAAAEVRSVASSRRSSQPRSVRSATGLRASAAGSDAISQVTSQVAPTEVYSELAEEDEWTAIQKFNTLLHYEEQKQQMLREQERKKLIREELDRQLKEKLRKKAEEVQEKEMYEQLQKEHIKLLGQREQEKLNLQRQKILQEKESRDRQLKEDRHRKRKEDKEQFRQEIELVERLQREMENERNMLREKREQERNYLRKMLQENEDNKRALNNAKAQEREHDIQIQEEYAKMLDKQEADRNHEFEQRERRAQDFMNKLASNVIKGQQGRKHQEDENLLKYELEREMRLRLEDERRAERDRQEKEEMRRLLAKQMNEKRLREAAEKAHNDEQAMIWKKDKENYEEEERRLNRKIKEINNENADFLQRQMTEKASRSGARRMNRQEFQLNKPLLREINDKKKNS